MTASEHYITLLSRFAVGIVIMMFMFSEPEYFQDQIHFWNLDLMHFMECGIVEQYSISNKTYCNCDIKRRNKEL
jgi:hypothetical protein